MKVMVTSSQLTVASMIQERKTFQVTCAIPRTGRTFENFLNKLLALGVDSTEIHKILEISKQSKAASSENFAQASQFLQQAIQQVACFGLFVDRKRQQRPYRLGFLGYEWSIGGVRVRVEGEEPHNGSSLIKLDEIDCAVVGLDELLTMTQYHLRNPTLVTKWGMYNYNLERFTRLRIAGSAQLTRYNSVLGREVQDMVGFFLISKPRAAKGRNGKSTPPSDLLRRLAVSGQRVFVKGRYGGIVTTAYPDLRITAVENVEEAVMEAEAGSVGLEIVQTGNTLRRKGLWLHGAPLFLSESLYVVDYYRYLRSQPLQDWLGSLNPAGYFEEVRIQQFALWYLALERNLGEAWVNKPMVTELFCEPQDAEHGLRPYRLQTRYWQPDDVYKQEEAIALVEEAKLKLRAYYEEYKRA